MSEGGGARLGDVLRVLRACGRELDADQVLDVLWLARRLPGGDAAPLHEGLRPAPPAPPEPTPAAPEQETVRPPAPEPDDEGLPDLTPSSLYAAAREPAPESRPAPARPAETRAAETRQAMPVRVPEGKALPDELALGRALRPLRRRHRSRHRFELDEELTAAELAETRVPDVVLRPVQERWLHLVLLVDDGLSMLLWHRLAAELRTLLERLGAFASTRVHGLDTRDARAPRLHTRPFDPDTQPVPTTTVNDPNGRTLALVVTDGMGAAWRHEPLYELLRAWSERGPVALLHTLPPEMWESSGVHAERWQATTRHIGGANTSWKITDPVLPPQLARFDGVPVPVLEPTAGALGDWAWLLASPGTTMELPLLARPSRHAAVTDARGLRSAQHFRDAATPEAYRLAAHLAAVSPLSVPVMRLVQSAVPWPARTAHLAEVFLGGLLRPHPAPVPGPLPAKHLVFDFVEDSKTVLLDAVPQAELLGTSRTIGRRLEQLAGHSPDFPAWLSHPDGAAELPGTHRPFTTVERRLLSRFGVSDGRRDGGPEPGGTAPELPDDDWAPLTDGDPARLGPYELRGRRRGRRTMVYRGVDEHGNRVVVRTPRPDLPAVNARLIEVEARVLERLHGRYAPVLVGYEPDGSPPWVAMASIADEEAPDRQPPRLADLVARAAEDGSAPFDTLAGLLVAWHLASALSVCHLNGVVLADFSADSVFVLRRSVVLGDLSDSAVDGHFEGAGPLPTAADNVRALGELLQLVSSKSGVNTPGLPEGMHLWQSDSWERLRRLVLRCLDPEPAERPAPGEIADLLARYIDLARAARETASPRAPQRPVARVPRVALTPPPGKGAPTPGALRLGRFGAARRRAEAQLERLRTPLRHGVRLTLLSAHPNSGRSTTTVLLGSVLAAARGEPVLAVDGAPDQGDLLNFVTGNRLRTLAGLREVARLPAGAPYEEIRARATRLPSGLQLLTHRNRQVVPSPTHQQEYPRLLALTDPYYAFVLTDWSPARLDASSWLALGLTDRLVLCCATLDQNLDAAARTLRDLRADEHRALADEVVVALVDVQGAGGRQHAEAARRLGVNARRVVRIPFDLTAPEAAMRGLDRLRPATTRAYLDLAAAVLDPGTE
ncbi:SAV_2336 N-terminal domain-related protein [Streptomyces sp. NPDC057877]|uniref:SAV_2336 N-terminal domain-related protein n=1 Tax=Streptomyces sp. NPDC057877 TaxID=3346269 RepID=UPI003680D3A5